MTKPQMKTWYLKTPETMWVQHEQNIMVNQFMQETDYMVVSLERKIDIAAAAGLRWCMTHAGGWQEVQVEHDAMWPHQWWSKWSYTYLSSVLLGHNGVLCRPDSDGKGWKTAQLVGKSSAQGELATPTETRDKPTGGLSDSREQAASSFFGERRDDTAMCHQLAGSSEWASTHVGITPNVSVSGWYITGWFLAREHDRSHPSSPENAMIHHFPAMACWIDLKWNQKGAGQCELRMYAPCR